MLPGHVPETYSPVIPHQHPMNPALNHQYRGEGMPGQPPYAPGSMPSPSPERPNTFNEIPVGQGFGVHHAMHSPHESVQIPPDSQPPMQIMGYQMHQNAMVPQDEGMMGQPGMPPMASFPQHHDVPWQGGGMAPNQQHDIQQHTNQRSTSHSCLAGNCQSENDTQMIQDL